MLTRFLSRIPTPFVPATVIALFTCGCIIVQRPPRGRQDPALQSTDPSVAEPASAGPSGGQAQTSTSPGRQPAQSSPPPPQNWRVSLKNNCNKTVRLFLGKRPKWGSGTNTTLGSNTISSYSGMPGDMIWIIDDKENGLSSISPSGNQDYQILPSCTGFGPK